MNILKIQTEVLKQIHKKSNDFIYGCDDTHIYISPDKYKLFKIPKDKFYLDLNKMGNPINAVHKMFDVTGLVDAHKTSELKQCDKGLTCVKFTSEKDSLWVDTKLLKEFEDCEITFKMTGKKAPLFIYEHDEVVGLILPVNVKEGE